MCPLNEVPITGFGPENIQTLSEENWSALFTQASIGPKVIKNRIALAPMTRVSAEEAGDANSRMQSYYEVFAEGGFGLLTTEGLYTDTEHSQGYAFQPGMATKGHSETWKPIIEAIHGYGAQIFAQLMHAGSHSQANRYATTTIGPSAVMPKGDQLGMYRGKGNYKVPVEITKLQMAEVRRTFVASALLAKDAGFDGLEIHGANGYLLDEFLTDYLNVRTDEYGGSPQNRVRFVQEICEDVKAAVGNDIAVGIRISQAKVSDNDHRWSGTSEEAQVIFEALGAAGMDFIHTAEYRAHGPAFDDGDESLASLAKRHSGRAVIANGNLDNPVDAAELLRSGSADLIALGKPALANRNWPQRVLSGEPISFELAQDQFAPLANVKDWELKT
jgi:2,4-dienoyl-CoA reductase-like NADH-dependent reductase (Old Yellow Enzyme family)